MVDAPERLRQRRDYLKVAAARRSVATAGLVLQGRPNGPGTTGEEAPVSDETPRAGIRFGLTASRRVGGAVQRNRAKRRLREALKLVLPEEGTAGWDYVVIARQETVSRPFEHLLSDLRFALRRINTVKPGGKPRRHPRRRKPDPAN